MKVFCPSRDFSTYAKEIFSKPDDKVIIYDGSYRVSLTDIKGCDLVLFMGGEDIFPNNYGESIKYPSIVKFNMNRDDWELRSFYASRDYNIPILGICRGQQLINVASGGSLYQDLFWDTGKQHPVIHSLDIKTDPLIEIFTEVNSFHHQAIKKLGKALIATSIYNKIIESTRGDGIVTTQFHPEFMFNDGNKNAIEFFDGIREWALSYKKQTTSIQETLNTKDYSFSIKDGYIIATRNDKVRIQQFVENIFDDEDDEDWDDDRENDVEEEDGDWE